MFLTSRHLLEDFPDTDDGRNPEDVYQLLYLTILEGREETHG